MGLGFHYVFGGGKFSEILFDKFFVQQISHFSQIDFFFDFNETYSVSKEAIFHLKLFYTGFHIISLAGNTK